MSPRCPECDKILVGIRATADGPQAQPCDCDLSETEVDELRSPFADRGRGTATDGGEDIPTARDDYDWVPRCPNDPDTEVSQTARDVYPGGAGA